MSDPGFPLHDPPWTRMSLLGVPQVRHAGLLTALRRERPCAVAVRVAVGTPPQSAVVRVLLGVEPEVAGGQSKDSTSAGLTVRVAEAATPG